MRFVGLRLEIDGRERHVAYCESCRRFAPANWAHLCKPVVEPGVRTRVHTVGNWLTFAKLLEVLRGRRVHQ